MQFPSSILFTALLLLACLASGQQVSSTLADSRTPDQKSSSKQASLPPVAQGVPSDFIIGPDDLLFIQVWKEPEVTRTVVVRPDGKVSLALVGEITASGKTARQLETEIGAKLSSFIADATVSVIVQEIRSRQFSVLGKVSHPGTYTLNRSLTVLDAIALAGGFRDFAKQSAIYILRQTPQGSQERLAFDYKAVIKGSKSEQNILLQPKDTVVVP